MTTTNQPLQMRGLVREGETPPEAAQPLTSTIAADDATPTPKDKPKLGFFLGVLTVAFGGVLSLLWSGFLLWLFFRVVWLLLS
jgi:hypothetical protein